MLCQATADAAITLVFHTGCVCQLQCVWSSHSPAQFCPLHVVQFIKSSTKQFYPHHLILSAVSKYQGPVLYSTAHVVQALEITQCV